MDKRDKWMTLSAADYYLGTQVQVTGGRVWIVMDEGEEGPYCFSSGCEARPTLSTRFSDLETWVH